MIKGSSTVLAVIGNPIKHSLSPIIHNRMINELQLDFVYIPLEIKINELGHAVQGFKAMSLAGFNVTVPFKEKIMPFLDNYDSISSQVGAVNTVSIKHGKCFGYNTDGLGFIYTLKTLNNYSLTNKKICLIGAGGTTRSLSVSLLNENIDSLNIINRTKDKADVLISNLKRSQSKTKCEAFSLDSPNLLGVLAQADIVVNTTSLGMKEGDTPLKNMEWVHEQQLVYDVIYSPSETMLLAQAKARGARTQNGLAMLVAQAVYAFELFTGKPASFKLMYEEALKHV